MAIRLKCVLNETQTLAQNKLNHFRLRFGPTVRKPIEIKFKDTRH